MSWIDYIPDLSDEQTRAVSEIFRDIGQVSLASVVIPTFVPGFEQSSIALMVSGAIFMVGMWFISIFLVKDL